MSPAADAIAALDEAWRVALAEAWRSWGTGSAGIGAVVSGPDGEIVAVGRNRMLEPRVEPGVLASTSIAHAEMNAMAVLPLGTPGPLTVTSTYEPCLMCAATLVQNRVARIRYAAPDPVFDGVHDGLAGLAFARERVPEREVLGGPLGAFAHVLHVSWLVHWMPDHVVDVHRRQRPEHLAVAQQVLDDGRLGALLAERADVVAAADALWPDLLALPD